MRTSYHPSPDEQRVDPLRTWLCLGLREGHMLRARDGSPCVTLYARGSVKGWVALIKGLGPDWSLEREFCPGLSGEHSDGHGRYLEYALTHEGLYEAECMLYAPRVKEDGGHRIYFSFTQASGIVLLSREQFDGSLRHKVEASFGEVRAHVAARQWRTAHRIASQITQEAQRQRALHYVQQSQLRWEQDLPTLQGPRLHVERASMLRRRALNALLEYGSRFAPGQGPARAELERAHQWFSSQKLASFWTGLQDAPEGARLWELYLLNHVNPE